MCVSKDDVAPISHVNIESLGVNTSNPQSVRDWTRQDLP